jgi:MFS family permease
MMLIAIGFAFAAACFGMAAATNILLLYVAFASLRALGQGSLNINAVLLVNQWFVAYRGRAIAFMGLGAVLSTAIFPPLARALIDNLGWREAYAVLGIIVMSLIVPVSLLVIRNRPEDMSLSPDGRRQPYVDTARHADAVSQEVSSGLETPVLRSLHFWLLALPMASPGMVSTALVFHQTSIFKEAGLTATLAAGVFVIFSVSAAFTSVIGGFVVERVSPKPLYGFSLLMLLVSLLLAVVMNSAFVAVLYVIIMGVANGAQQIVQGVIWAHYYGRHRLGRIQGPAMTIGICGSAIGPFPLALLHDVTGSYTFGLLVMISLPVLSLISILFAHPTASRVSTT